MAKEDINLAKIARVSEFVEQRKEIYQQELRDSLTDVEKFVWSEMISLLDEISMLTEAESLLTFYSAGLSRFKDYYYIYL